MQYRFCRIHKAVSNAGNNTLLNSPGTVMNLSSSHSPRSNEMKMKGATLRTRTWHVLLFIFVVWKVTKIKTVRYILA